MMNKEIREHYEDGMTIRRGRWLVLAVGLVLIVLLAGDWFMRFHWFRWHETIYIKQLFTADRPADEIAKSFSTLTLAEGRGGDLSRLIGLKSARAVYEQYRPEEMLSVDPYGFRSLPYDLTNRFDLVVVGDSYMAEGVPLTNQMSTRLSSLLGRPVLNRAFMGRGPFQSLMLWIEQNRAADQRPKWLIWGFVERDISGTAFAGYVYLLERHIQMGAEKEVKAAAESKLFLWSRLAPSELRKSLPNSSALAQVSRKAWSYVRYIVLRELPPEVFAFEPVPEDPRPMLGYAITRDSMYWTPQDRDLDKVVWSIEKIRDYLASLGVQLLVVPIPDKEQVYRERIPRSVWINDIEPPASMLPELVSRLQSKGIPAVSLLPVYREQASKGVELYWRDDTHWSAGGIQVAAELIAAELRGSLQP